MAAARKAAPASTAALVLASAGIAVTAPAARAATITVNYTCTVPVIGATAASVQITLDAPTTTPKVGDTLAVSWKTQPVAALASPLPFAADTIKPSGSIGLSGAQSGSVAMSGPRANPAYTPNTPFPVGDMAGSVELTAAGTVNIAPGNFSLDVLYNGNSIVIPCTAAGPVTGLTLTVAAAPRATLSLAPTHGPAGAATTVTGSGYTPGAAVTVAGYVGAARSGDAAVTATADASGAFAVPYTVADPATDTITASEPSGLKASRPYTVDPVVDPGDAATTIGQPVRPGQLTLISDPEAAVTLPQVTLNGRDNTSSGDLVPVRVQDFRGGTLGWSLTGTVTDFVGTELGEKIPAGNLAWTPACAARPGSNSPSQVKSGPAGALSSTDARTLCNQAVSPDGKVTGGDFDAKAGLALVVPAYQKADDYYATLTLTLA
ncbi:beta-xylosidase [Yinghuangia soli]|uniref:Beta-xylosidase n=1 Tax=Yinghuangia soli TaxID=2908204 RepID=A0AA41Q7D6_9ACTN|nr:beta-xylosidase [Yinghuangia soli]MCF2531537.1 beta-xylosidase [Yinghuangia soli]